MRRSAIPRFSILLWMVLCDHFINSGSEELSSSTAVLREKMEEFKVVPDIIPQVPPQVLSLQYGDIDTQPGQELTPTQVKDAPKVSWATERGTYYTLLMIDPDVVPPNITNYTHWMVVNIPGKNISAGKSVYDYFGSGPREGTGLHRYVFLVYKQPDRIESSVTNAIKDEKLTDRLVFSTDDFVKTEKLSGPIAANFYRAQYDDYVPTLGSMLVAKYGPLPQ